MRRREFLKNFGGVAAAIPVAAYAQHPLRQLTGLACLPRICSRDCWRRFAMSFTSLVMSKVLAYHRAAQCSRTK